ncbi:hypothetical protein, partial [Enterobacter bugandensis]|uniref:hypothetical protein n=1 Tax=Enterobacter bugandensis TaxID=881260 RepID=UPI00195491B3
GRPSSIALAMGSGMNARPVAALGVALTTFLAVAALLTDLLAARIAFSAIVGLPVGLIADLE